MSKNCAAFRMSGLMFLLLLSVQSAFLFLTNKNAYARDFFTSAVTSALETLIKGSSGFDAKIENIGFSDENIILYNIVLKRLINQRTIRSLKDKNKTGKSSIQKKSMSGVYTIKVKKALLNMDQTDLYSGHPPEIRGISAEQVMIFLPYENSDSHISKGLLDMAEISTKGINKSNSPDFLFEKVSYRPFFDKSLPKTKKTSDKSPEKIKKLFELRIFHKKNRYTLNRIESKIKYYSLDLLFADPGLTINFIQTMSDFINISDSSAGKLALNITLKNRTAVSSLLSSLGSSFTSFFTKSLREMPWIREMLFRSSVSGRAELLVSSGAVKNPLVFKKMDITLENRLSSIKIKTTSSGVYSVDSEFRNAPLEKIFSLADPSLAKGVSGNLSGSFSTIVPGFLYNPHISANFKNVVLKNFRPITDNLMSTRDIQVNIGVLSLFTKNRNRQRSMQRLLTQIETFNNALEYVFIPEAHIKIRKIKEKKGISSLQLISGRTGNMNFAIQGEFKDRIPFKLECFSLNASGLENKGPDKNTNALKNLRLSGSLRLETSILPGSLTNVSMRLGGSFLSPEIKYDYSPFLSLLTPIFTGSSSDNSNDIRYSEGSGQNSRDTDQDNDNPFLRLLKKTGDNSEEKNKKIKPINILLDIIRSGSKK